MESSQSSSSVRLAPQSQVRMFDSNNNQSYGDAPDDEDDEEQNSLVTSMNGAAMVPYRRMVPQAPLVSQMSDNEDEELERIIRQP